jgi:DNA-binding protein YbaB
MGAFQSSEEALSSIDRDIEQAAERARAAREWRQQIDDLTGRGEASRGAVRVTVETTGLITSLEVSDSVCDEGGAAVGRAVMEAMRAAQADVREQILRSSDVTWGEDSEISRRMAQELDERFAAVDRADDQDPGLPGEQIDWGR